MVFFQLNVTGLLFQSFRTASPKIQQEMVCTKSLIRQGTESSRDIRQQIRRIPLSPTPRSEISRWKETAHIGTPAAKPHICIYYRRYYEGTDGRYPDKQIP